MELRRAEATFSSFIACSFVFSVEPSYNALPLAAQLCIPASPAMDSRNWLSVLQHVLSPLSACFYLHRSLHSDFCASAEVRNSSNSAFRYPIPYPTSTNQYNTHTLSSSPVSVTQHWSAPSDHSLRIIQTENYNPRMSKTGIALLNTLVGSTVSVPESHSEGSVSSMLQSPMSTEAMTPAPAEGIATELPKLRQLHRMRRSH